MALSTSKYYLSERRREKSTRYAVRPPLRTLHGRSTSWSPEHGPNDSLFESHKALENHQMSDPRSNQMFEWLLQNDRITSSFQHGLLFSKKNERHLFHKLTRIIWPQSDLSSGSAWPGSQASPSRWLLPAGQTPPRCSTVHNGWIMLSAWYRTWRNFLPWSSQQPATGATGLRLMVCKRTLENCESGWNMLER